MDFSRLVPEKLNSLLSDNGLSIISHTIDSVEYASSSLFIALRYDSREKASTLWVGPKSGKEIEVNTRTAKEYFGFSLDLDHLSPEKFFENVYLFFLNEGEKLLRGTKDVAAGLELFLEQMAKDYSTALIEQQNIAFAEEAWKNGNYVDAVKCFMKVNAANLTPSQKKKYRIALRKLGITDG